MSIVAPLPPAYLAGLNEPQRQAVETLDGPVLVLAGAGTGKTRVLTTRLAHILTQHRAFPSQILAVTFTNKAAREMRDRLERLIGGATDGLWLGTFHSLAARILRRHAELVGLRSDFTILDSDDQVRLIKQLMQSDNIDDRRWAPRAVLGVIERWKDRGLASDGITPKEAAEAAGPDFARGRLASLYKDYQARLRALNATDFGDLLLHNLTIFRAHPTVLAEYQNRFRYLLVDEYQDTNVAQYLWLRLLAQGHHHICCVGDDDQSIYGWRGAEVGNILRFEHDFPGAVIIRLEENYRSTPEILATASHLIAHNKGRLGKTLWTNAASGEPIRLRGVWDGEQEARWVADEIEAAGRVGTKLSQIAVLVRVGFQTREFEERFIAIGLPYRVIGGPRFYERQEIRDALAYFRLIQQPADDLAFERIVNLPRRGIGPTTLQTLHDFARREEIPLTQASERLLASDEFRPATRKALGGFLRDLDRWRMRGATLNHTDLAREVLDESGYTAMWQADRTPEAPGRLENLKELVVAMAEFETLIGFLEHVSLVMEAATEAGSESVTVMTLHAAKGLEFDLVFLPGWEEGVFPNQRALDESGEKGLEEERRLAYVGLTRARKRAMISCAANRRLYGQWQSALPSRFIDELPQDRIDRQTETGLYAGQTRTSSWGEAGAYASRSFERRPASTGFAPVTQREDSFTIGERIFHEKFGPGTIRHAEADKLTVAFDQAGEKRVMAAFIRKA